MTGWLILLTGGAVIIGKSTTQDPVMKVTIALICIIGAEVYWQENRK